MPESKMQIILPTSEEMRKLGLTKEITEAKPTIHEKADQNYYSAIVGPTLGKAIFSVIAGRDRSRMKAFENKDVQMFFANMFRFVEKRAHEMGYFTHDVEISKISGITPDGTIVLKVVPKPYAKRIAI